MKQYKIGVIRVLTTEDQEALNVHGKLLEKYFPMFQTESRCIPGHTQGIHDEETIASGTPEVVALAEKFEKDGFDAVIISCCGDPGLNEAQERVRIPVIGAGKSTAVLSILYGMHSGDLGIMENVPETYVRILKDRMVGALRGNSVKNTTDLRTEAGYRDTMDAAWILKKKGADVITLSCTGMSTSGFAPKIANALDLPVLDPVLCEGTVALFSLLLKENNKGD